MAKKTHFCSWWTHPFWRWNHLFSVVKPRCWCWTPYLFHHQSACLSCFVIKNSLLDPWDFPWDFEGVSNFPWDFPWDFPIFHGIFHGISKVTTVIKRKAWAPKWFRSLLTRRPGRYRIGVKYFSSGAMGASRGTVLVRQMVAGKPLGETRTKRWWTLVTLW